MSPYGTTRSRSSKNLAHRFEMLTSSPFSLSILWRDVSFAGFKDRFSHGWKHAITGGPQETEHITDEHYMQMLKYKPVPKWWFGCILVISFAIAQATNYAGKSHMPWWALIVVLVIAFVVSLYETDLKARMG